VKSDKNNQAPTASKNKKKKNEGKNKGAPKWLKQKRQSEEQ